MIDRSGLFLLYMDAFPRDSEQYARYFISSVNDDNIVTATRDGKIVSAGYLVNKNAEIFGKNILIKYLSAVGTLSEFRGRGIVAEVIKSAFNHAFNSNCAFISLSPFNFEYYKRYDFVDASHYGESTIVGGHNFDIKQVTCSDIPHLIKLYKNFAQGYTFKEVANESYFINLINELKVDNESMWIIKNDDGSPFSFVAIDRGEIVKFATDDSAKFREINAFKGMHFSDFNLHQHVYTQMRITNVESFLNLPIYAEQKLDYCFSIFDNIISENNGVYRVEIVEGIIKVSKVSNLRNDNFINISDLAKAFFDGKYPFMKPKLLFEDKY